MNKSFTLNNITNLGEIKNREILYDYISQNKIKGEKTKNKRNNEISYQRNINKLMRNSVSVIIKIARSNKYKLIPTRVIRMLIIRRRK